jgi:2-iminobutanoate/2-iminopropanoate deaminase
MPKKRIHTERAPKPVGPYSQAVEVDGWLYIAGQVPIEPSTGVWVTGDMAQQAERVLHNIQAILEAAGASLQDVVKTTVYVADLSEFAVLNEVYARFFADACPPARATIAAKSLPGSCRVEIDAVARIGAAR